MTDLIVRIRAAIDHTEQLARAALHNPSRYDHDLRDHVDTGVDDGEWVADGREVNTANPARSEGFPGGIAIYDEGGHNEEQAQHIAHNDPAAVLRRCAADRKILDIHEREENRYGSGTACSNCDADRHEIYFSDRQGCDTVLALADAYGITDGGEA